MFYWFLKWIAIGPLLRVVFRPDVEGAENVPEEGPAILASNHLSYADWLFMPLTLTAPGHLRRQGRVLHHPGHQGLVPEEVLLRRRPGADRPLRRLAAEGALSSAKRILEQGELFGIYPEGTRSHDGRLYRGKTGVARLALETGVPVDPGRRARHRRRGAARQEVRHVHPARRPVRQAAGLLPLRGHGERPLHPAVDHRRDHVRDHAALRPGVRRHVRLPRQGGVQAARAGGRRRPTAAAEAEIGGADATQASERPRRPDRRLWSRPALAVEDRLFRALAILRVVVLVNAVALNLYRADNFDRPVAGVRAASR